MLRASFFVCFFSTAPAFFGMAKSWTAKSFFEQQ
jgi:hypothetical protein